MKNNRQNETASLAQNLVAQKGKAIVAVALVSLMLIMWVRVVRNRTANANAAVPVAVAADANASASPARITYLELPRIKGRHDRLNKDFFSSEGWDSDSSSVKTDTRGEFVSANGEIGNDTIAQFQQELKLEAISAGKTLEAFISGNLVAPGQKFSIKKAGTKYEFTVVSISSEDVVLSFKNNKFKLVLPKQAEPQD